MNFLGLHAYGWEYTGHGFVLAMKSPTVREYGEWLASSKRRKLKGWQK